ncbi:MAG: metal-dependent transcriptional regulator [bacterium]|nr:metal-dependent transcriptional regulator [bacterium]
MKNENKKISDLETFYGATDLSSHMEDYMEAIALLAANNKVVRVKDIAQKLDIKMPSVTAALNKLKEMSLIEYEKYGFVELTEQGESIAMKVCNRHSCLLDFFTHVLMLENKTANIDACKVEHNLSPETCTRIHKFLEFYKSEEKNNREWINKLKTLLTD